jgi:hypothetical protein
MNESTDADGIWSEAVNALSCRLNMWSPWTFSDAVRDSDIRRWAIAVYWPDKPPRLYWNEFYANETKWCGIVAPQDFNPFTWSVSRGKVVNPRDATVGDRIMNGGQEDRFYAPIRPGDIIRSRSRLIGWKVRTTKLGSSLITYTEIEWRNEADALVKIRLSTQIRY